MPHFTTKDPDEEINFQIDFANGLDAGETISVGDVATTWTAPAGITAVTQSFTADGKAKVRLSGGVLNKKYDVVVSVKTSSGQKILDSLQINMVNRKVSA